MSTDGENQAAYSISNQIMLALCLIFTCLHSMPLEQEQGDQILIWFNLVIGYLLVMVSIFAPSAKVREAAAQVEYCPSWNCSSSEPDCILCPC
uniref:Uncharacterized protein n=1 Tax=Oryza brachyantha TaxID=4533 RepID=J3LWJ3_ORYBR